MNTDKLGKSVRDWGAFLPLWLLELILIVPVAFVWYMSPLGLGFHNWPKGVLGSSVKAVYFISYFLILPMLLLSWFAGPILFAAGRIKIALRLPMGMLASLIILATIVISFV